MKCELRQFSSRQRVSTAPVLQGLVTITGKDFETMAGTNVSLVLGSSTCGMTMARTARAKDAKPHDPAEPPHSAVITVCDVPCCRRAAKQTRRVAAKIRGRRSLGFFTAGGLPFRRATPPTTRPTPRTVPPKVL